MCRCGFCFKYGEVFIEERNGTWNTPYLFNGKELDEETGLYYYGARYLNPTNGMWLSTDPLFEDYKGVSPYAYCLGNPVKHIDIEGEWVNFAIGALAGVACDYAFQVAENALKNGGLSSDCFTDIDVKSLVVSGVTGAVGVGVGNVASKFAKVTRFSKGVTEESFKGKVIEELYQVSSDVGTSAVSKLVKGEEVTLEACVVDAAGGVIGRKVQKNFESSRVGKQKILERDADRYARIAGTKPGAKNEGKIARPAQISRAKASQSKVDNYKKHTEYQSTLKGGVASNISSNTLNMFLDQKTKNEN